MKSIIPTKNAIRAFDVGWRKPESRPCVQEELHMKAKSSLHRYIAIITGRRRKPLVSVFALCLFAGWGAFGATYKLVDLGSASSPVEFSDLANWKVNGEPATVLPGTDDTIDWDGGAWAYP